MSFLAPKVDWSPVDGVTDADLNRIEGNIVDINTNKMDMHGAVFSSQAASGGYAKVATITLTGQYQESRVLLSVMGFGGSSPQNCLAMCMFRVHQQGIMGTAPFININVTGFNYIGPRNFVAITRQNDASATIVDLYIQQTLCYEGYVITPLRMIPSQFLTMCSGGALVIQCADLPVGTKTVGIYESTDLDHSYAANGYQRLPSDLIIQWGSFSGFANGFENYFSLPVSFPNAILASFGSFNGSDSNTNPVAVRGSLLCSYYQGHIRQNDLDANVSSRWCSWLVIGF